jgi:hypothetical protein
LKKGRRAGASARKSIGITVFSGMLALVRAAHVLSARQRTSFTRPGRD